jgi:hypothetical protein
MNCASRQLQFFGALLWSGRGSRPEMTAMAEPDAESFFCKSHTAATKGLHKNYRKQVVQKLSTVSTELST